MCAEWNLGGIPTWLQFNRPGIRYRSYEEQWRTAVQKWFGMVIKQTRSYFADHGGPIVLAQVENELGGADPRYVQWNGDMANAFNVGVPWLMCNGESANNTINSCNANDCTGFLSGHGQSGRILVDQPALVRTRHRTVRGDVVVVVAMLTNCSLCSSRSVVDGE